MGSDSILKIRCFTHQLFQSTLPVWGATFVASELDFFGNLFQSTLPVWGATIW